MTESASSVPTGSRTEAGSRIGRPLAASAEGSDHGGVPAAGAEAIVSHGVDSSGMGNFGHRLQKGDRKMVQLRTNTFRSFLAVPLAILAGLVLPATGQATAPAECSGDADCGTRCASINASLGKPAAKLTAIHGGKCDALGQATKDGTGSSVLGCMCNLDPRGSSFIFLGKMGKEGGCIKYGRSRKCLYTESEFPGCDRTASETSCAGPCKVLQDRIRADETEAHQASVHGAKCDGMSCICVLKIEGACFVGSGNKTYDCSLSASAIIEIWREEQAEKGGANGCSCSPVAGHGSVVTMLLLLLLAAVPLNRRSRSR